MVIHREDYDVCIIGSGFGGTMTAWKLVHAGYRVLMIERGDWVKRGPNNWSPEGSVDLTPYYSFETPVHVLRGGNKPVMGLYTCVGGPSVFYGGVSFRFREADFEEEPEIVGDSGAEWPVKYRDLAPYYDEAERLLDVAGVAGEDPTEPPRPGPYPQAPGPLSPVSEVIVDAGRSLGLRPFHLPLAINYHRPGQNQCERCSTCDTFACAVSAKNDLATRLIPRLIEKGMTLKPRTVAVQLKVENRRVVLVRCFDKDRGEWVEYRARVFVLAAGALATPHLILSSELDRFSSAPEVIGTHLTRHMNAIVFGYFPNLDVPFEIFHKQIGFHDFYFGHPELHNGLHKLGSIQQVQSPPVGLVRHHAFPILRHFLPYLARRTTGLLVMAEDQPRPENRVFIRPEKRDVFGLPQLIVEHTYTKRDRAALQVLIRCARQILRRAGARFFYVHHIRTFSHAVGTVRMGPDARRAPVDENTQFRGLDNLFITDGSVLPTAAGLNPSLTIAAIALRAGEILSDRLKKGGS